MTMVMTIKALTTQLLMCKLALLKNTFFQHPCGIALAIFEVGMPICAHSEVVVLAVIHLVNCHVTSCQHTVSQVPGVDGE